MTKILINSDRCSGCGICVALCPELIYYQRKRGLPPETSHESLCISCGQCVAACPDKVIFHSRFQIGRLHTLNTVVNLPSYEVILEFLQSRRLTKLLTRQPVDLQTIEKILSSAQIASSGHGMQEAQYLIIHKQETLRQILDEAGHFYWREQNRFSSPLAKRLSPDFIGMDTKRTIEELRTIAIAHDRGEDLNLYQVPCLVVFHAENTPPFSDIRAGLSLYNVYLSAQSLGLGCFIVGYLMMVCRWDRRMLHILGIPEYHHVYGVLAIGYPYSLIPVSSSYVTASRSRE